MEYGKLKKNWQFGNVYRSGGKYLNGLFILYVLPNGTRETRIGLTVTKKVGGSVQRNRIKRVIREVFGSLKEVASGHDLVVVARSSAINLKYSQAQNSLKHLLYQARMLRRERN